MSVSGREEGKVEPLRGASPSSLASYLVARRKKRSLKRNFS
jgi:hypothetical protein